jgi:hypothetical protein
MNFFEYNAIKAWTSNTHIFVQLASGEVASLPIAQFPLLQKATPQQLQQVQIVDGYALYWEELGEDLSVAGFFENQNNAVDDIKA